MQIELNFPQTNVPVSNVTSTQKVYNGLILNFMHPPLVKAPAQNCFYSAFNFEALQGTFDISNILSH